MRLTIIILLLAQLQVSHFKRPDFPGIQQMLDSHRHPRIFRGKFTMPQGGYTIFYRDLFRADYMGGKVPVVPQFCDHWPCDGGNQNPIYDVDESYDHITVKAKPGTKWWYIVTIAVQKKEPSP